MNRLQAKYGWADHAKVVLNAVTLLEIMDEHCVDGVLTVKSSNGNEVRIRISG